MPRAPAGYNDRSDGIVIGLYAGLLPKLLAPEWLDAILLGVPFC